ncbi:hypothetical protein AB0J52_00245, partial [Spirillospora sp. NPDC049652]
MHGRPARRGRSSHQFAQLARVGQLGRFAARRGRRDARRSRYDDFPGPEALGPMWAPQYGPRRHPSRSGLVARTAMRGYIRWVAQSPDTRGLGTGLAALYPAGQLSHTYLPHDTLTLAAFAPPAALAAWVA